MFYKRSDMVKYSIVLAGALGMLNSSALAQNNMDLLGDISISEQKEDTQQNLKKQAPVKSEIEITEKTEVEDIKNDNQVSKENKDEKISLTIDETISNTDLGNKDILLDETEDDLLSPQTDLLADKEEIAEKKDGSLDDKSIAGEDNISSEPKKEEKTEEDNAVVKAYNNLVDQQDLNAMNSNKSQEEMTLGDKIMSQVKEDLFSQMADIEKQTGLLTLELKREKIKNEIAAMKAQRERAEEEELEKQKEKERRQAEWEKEQERKTLVEQQKLKDLEIRYEKLRQERVLKAYKENMLKNNQDWVDYNARLYNKLVNEEKVQADILKKQKKYSKEINDLIAKANVSAKNAKDKYTKDISNLQTQIAILKSKLEAVQAEKNAAASAAEAGKKTVSGAPNPFALASGSTNKEMTKKLPEEYAIMEISGKGDRLVAKLINKNGGTFMVKPGTVLNTGHVIEEITQTYITADRGGIKDYLYFSAGGILDKEPTKPISASLKASVTNEADAKAAEAAPVPRIPSLREGMFVE